MKPQSDVLPRQKSVSLKTVAEHVGLSTAAVSRVLSGSAAAQSIPAATQQRIHETARLLNYRPNLLARSLRRGRSHTIGVLVPEISDGFTTLVLGGLEQGLFQAGYFLNILSHHHQAERIDQAQTMLMERAIDGMIAIDTRLTRYDELPIVTISCPDTQGRATSLVLNEAYAAELAINHLTGLGHRQIALIKGQSFSSSTEPRWDAIQQAARRAHLRLRPELFAQLEGESPSHEPGYFAAQRLLASGLPFTAVFSFNDVAAIGAIRALREAGLRVPQDVSVIGFDDVQSAAYQNPGLTTVRQPLHTMGFLAAEAIVRQIHATPHPHASRQIVINPELIVRASTSAPPQRQIAAG